MVPYRKVQPGEEGEGREGRGRRGREEGREGREKEEVSNILSLSRSGVTSTNQFGMRAFSGPRNIVPTLVACSRDE